MALLDSGSKVILVHTNLVDAQKLQIQLIVAVCVHGDTKDYHAGAFSIETTSRTW